MLMATMTQYNKVFKFIIIAISINMMYIHSIIFSFTNFANLSKINKSFFSINKFLAFFFYCFSNDTFKSNRVFFSKKLILTFGTTIFSRFRYVWLNFKEATTILTLFFNTWFGIKFMKTLNIAKNLFSVRSVCCKRFSTALTNNFNTFLSRFMIAFFRAKDLSFVVSFKNRITYITGFVHDISIPQLVNNVQLKYIPGV
jgi:hypothetical protein